MRLSWRSAPRRFPWGAWEGPRNSPTLPASWPPTPAPTSPGRPSMSTAEVHPSSERAPLAVLVKGVVLAWASKQQVADCKGRQRGCARGLASFCAQSHQRFHLGYEIGKFLEDQWGCLQLDFFV